MDRIIFKDFYRYVPMVKDRWTPIYLEHGHLEVNNYSLSWIDEKGKLDIPVAMISAIMLGPGSTITHAAIVICSKSNTPIVWIGEEGLHFYAFGVSVNEKCHTAIKQATLFADINSKTEIAKKMFLLRFPDVDVSNTTIDILKGMEGNRIRNAYKEYATKYDITWVCRNTNGIYGIDVDDLNASLNILNANLYSICLSAITTLGYIPSLGFVHSDGKIPFVYDIADLYKVDLCFDVAFSTFSSVRKLHKDLLIQNFIEKVSKYKLLEKLPKDLANLFV
jgi:CRISPR-associated protein Cas1